MSRNILSHAIKLHTVFKKQEFDYKDYKHILTALGASIIVHGVYSTFTDHEDTIKVTEKYIPPRNVSAKYIIHGKNGPTPIAFEIPSNIWWWQWNVDEMYSKMEIGKTYKIKYYGFRIPCLDMFPGIVGIEEAAVPPNVMAVSWMK